MISWGQRLLVKAALFFSAALALQQEIPLAAIFDEEGDPKLQLAFVHAVDRINQDPNILPGKKLAPQIVSISAGRSYDAEVKVCSLLEMGVAGVFGPQNSASADHIRSVTDVAEIPFIDTRWNYRPQTIAKTGSNGDPPKGFDYTITLHPDVNTLGKAYIDLITQYGWESITILYEDNDSMMRLKEIFDVTSEIIYPSTFRLIIKQLKSTPENGYRDVLRDVYNSLSTFIILDCSKDVIGDVLKQAQQIGMISEYYYFLLTSMDAHTVDLEDFKYGGTNFTAFRLIDTSKPEVKAVILDIVKKEMSQGRMLNVQDGNLDTNTALIYDAVHLFALALHQVSQIQEIELTPISCKNEDSWAHGSTLVNYMKLMEFTGLSGLVQFDARGLRTHFYIDVLELQSTGLEPIGTWCEMDGLNLTRVQEVTEVTNPVNVMANKTFVVTLKEEQPYTMLKEETKKLEGNDRFEGFAIDLMTEIAKFLQFNVSFKLVDDGKYGSQDEHGNWDGMIKEVMIGTENGGADFAIADLSVTSSRASAVAFSMPWMNLGISILFIKPRPAPPSMLSFLSPFTVEVWMYTAFAYVFVSLVLFVLARISPYEWDNPFPCIEEPEELVNQFSLANTFWFTIGTLMQQGCDVAPISLSTRMLAGMWYFFALIMIASYTANLAAFLTVETLEKPIESAEDLAEQTEIKYGVVEGGSTMTFFQKSNVPAYQKMWNFMSGMHRSEVMVSNNAEGIEKVMESDGKYAFMMESSSIQYKIERNCKLTQIGGELDNKGYGIAMAHGSPYKSLIDSAILHVQESGVLHNLKVRWWKQKRGGGACAGGGSEGGVAELGLPNVAGVFIVTVIGCIFASLLTVFEFFYGSKQQATELGTSWGSEIKEELNFAFKCYGSSKTVRKPPGSGSTSHSGSKNSVSSEDKSESRRSSVSRFKKRKSSISSVENPYAKSNTSNHYGETGYGRQSNKSPSYGKAGNPFESDKE